MKPKVRPEPSIAGAWRPIVPRPIAYHVGYRCAPLRNEGKDLPTQAPGEGLVFNLDCVTNRKLSTAARAIHEPTFFTL
jgi:hypothetical protein